MEPKVEGVGAFLMGAWWKARKAVDVMGVCLRAAVTANGRRIRNAIVLCAVCVWWVMGCLMERVAEEAETIDLDVAAATAFLLSGKLPS